MSAVEDHIDGLDPAVAAAVRAIRRVVLASHDGVDEHIKWNGPSFRIDGDDRITVGLNPKGGVRAVLHRGVKPKDTSGFVFEDDSGLVKWAAPDRGVVAFADAAAVEARAEAFQALCRRWFAATR